MTAAGPAGSEEPRTNHLRDEHSAYLLAHVRDAVDWVPWGPRALKFAAKTGRPLLVSVGHSGCDVARTMQREAFLDADLAGFINRHFVPVLVDGWARPDVEAFYAAFVAASAGAWGPLLTVFAGPDGAPFFGGSYFPRSPADPGAPSFADVLDDVLRTWTLDRIRVAEASHRWVELLSEASREGLRPMTSDDLDSAREALIAPAPPEQGDTATAPNVPSFGVLAACAARGDARCRVAAEAALASFEARQVIDPGHGVRREPLDAASPSSAQTLLCDQGAMLSALAALYAAEPTDAIAATMRAIVAFLLRELPHPDGGFLASWSAEEGATGDRLTSWNALVSAGLIDAGRALGDGELVSAGTRTLDWLLENAVRDTAVARTPGPDSNLFFLEDSASLALACVSAASAGLPDHAATARSLLHRTADRFALDGGRFALVVGKTALPYPPVERGDGATPSGAATLALACARLASLTGDDTCAAIAHRALSQFAATAKLAPSVVGCALQAALEIGL